MRGDPGKGKVNYTEFQRQEGTEFEQVVGKVLSSGVQKRVNECKGINRPVTLCVFGGGRDNLDDSRVKKNKRRNGVHLIKKRA